MGKGNVKSSTPENSAKHASQSLLPHLLLWYVYLHLSLSSPSTEPSICFHIALGCKIVLHVFYTVYHYRCSSFCEMRRERTNPQPSGQPDETPSGQIPRQRTRQGQTPRRTTKRTRQNVCKGTGGQGWTLNQCPEESPAFSFRMD